MSIETLAESSHLDPSYVSNVERGAQNPSLAVLARLARGLGVDLPSLVDADPHRDRATLQRYVATRVKGLDVPQLRALARWLEVLPPTPPR